MKDVLAGYTGGSGKTMIASEVYVRNIPSSNLIALESVNETAEAYGTDVEMINGENFASFYKKIILMDDVIIDVGASNVVAFLSGLVRFVDVQKEFRSFIIPSAPGVREQKEAIAMVETLSGLGIEPNRIKVVCNRVKDDVEEEFSTLFMYAKKSSKCEISRHFAIYETELIDMLHTYRISLNALLFDTNDYRAMARSLDPAKDQREINRCTSMHVMKSLAVGVAHNFDSVFNHLFPGRS